MHTLEEINKTAKSQGTKAFWKIFLFFALVFPILGLLIILFFAPKENIDMESVTGFLLSFFPASLIAGILAGVITNIIVFVGVKKKMKEENQQEEQQKREEHYHKMEELLEKMTNEKNQPN